MRDQVAYLVTKLLRILHDRSLAVADVLETTKTLWMTPLHICSVSLMSSGQSEERKWELCGNHPKAKDTESVAVVTDL